MQGELVREVMWGLSNTVSHSDPFQHRRTYVRLGISSISVVSGPVFQAVLSESVSASVVLILSM